jgi:hypothetical protein
MRRIARDSGVSVGCLRSIVARATDHVTLGTAIAISCGLGLGSVEALLGSLPSQQLGTTRESESQGQQLAFDLRD